MSALQPVQKTISDHFLTICLAFIFWVGVLIGFFIRYLVYFPLLLLSGLLIDVLLLFIGRFMTGRKLRFFPTSQELEHLEDEMYLRDSPSATFQHQYISLAVPYQESTIEVDAHAVIAHSKGPQEKSGPENVLLIVHGTAASGACFSELIGALDPNTTVVLLDLPGFGRTSTRPRPHTLEKTSTIFFLDFIAKFLDHNRYKSVRLLGHSWGAYLCICFARQYPERIEQLLLLDTPGICPTLSKYACYWSFAFKYVSYCAFSHALEISIKFQILRCEICGFRYSIPNFGRPIGRAGTWAMFAWYRLFKCTNPAVYYWYAIINHPEGWGDKLVAAHITLNWLTSWWNEPALHDLIDVAAECPTKLLIGEGDPIIPASQMEALAEGLNLESHIFKDGDHNNFHEIRPGIVAELAEQIEAPPLSGNRKLRSTRRSRSTSASEIRIRIEKSSLTPKVLPVWGAQFHSTFSWTYTNKVVTSLHDQMRSWKRD